MSVQELKRPLRRRVGRLVITITTEGVELRGYRRRRLKRFVTWSQIATLSDATALPLLATEEQTLGISALLALNADPSAPVAKKGSAK